MAGILNYTTEVPIERTIGEIEAMLAKAGAQKILKEYDASKNISALSFMVKTDRGMMPFRLPMNVRAVMQVINDGTEQWIQRRYGRDRAVPKKFYNDTEQAKRVGWRIIKDWLEAQLALIELKMVKIQEIFLPYTIGIDGRTLYEQIEKKGFEGYVLEDFTGEEFKAPKR